jgi:hypothetical protein
MKKRRVHIQRGVKLAKLGNKIVIVIDHAFHCNGSYIYGQIKEFFFINICLSINKKFFFFKSLR